MEQDRYSALRQHSRESNALTRECIKSAMQELAGERSLQEISITALCKKAGVSRMAFYRNYSIIEDVFYEIASDLNHEVSVTIGSPFRTSTDRNWYVKIFSMIAAHKQTMQLMIQQQFQFEWMRAVNGFAVHDGISSTEQIYQRLMWSGGFENTINQWLNTGMKETPEQMAEYCIRYLPHLIITEE